MRLPEVVKQEIIDEIERAVALHGEQTTLPDSVWCCIATEEMGEIAQGVLKEGFQKPESNLKAANRHTDTEIVQLASVLIHWLCIRRGYPQP